MKYIKMFIAGIAFPSTLFPFLFTIAWTIGKTQIFTIPFLHFIPLLWGVWNILYLSYFYRILPENVTLQLLLTGAILGLLVALYGVFGLNIPSLIELPKSLTYLPLIVAPILYAIVWLFIVNPLNRLLDLLHN